MLMWRRMTSCAVGVAATLAVAGCGTATIAGPAADAAVEATDYATLPPPTTTIAPTTTLPPEPGSVLTAEATYVVVEGDYPYQVAARFEVNFEDFVALNGWTIADGQVPDWPTPGTTIRIPAGAKVPGGASVLVPVATTTTTTDPLASIPPDSSGTSTATDPAAPEPTAAASNGVGCGTYTVVAGDYLTRVATKLDTTVDKLDAANSDTAGYGAFYVGLQINVPC